jgi:2-desacetyl-2-hydroxyethyl bacteriochlorophyllide A dehydrogenase
MRWKLFFEKKWRASTAWIPGRAGTLPLPRLADCALGRGERRFIFRGVMMAMKAAIFVGAGRPMEIDTVIEPKPGEGQVLIRVGRCGVCGSDLHSTAPDDPDHPTLPGFATVSGTVLGHEFAGEVVALGKGISNLKIGSCIASLAGHGCGKCASCTEGQPIWCERMRAVTGGYAEYALVNEHACITLPKSLSMADGALIEPLATGLHAVELAAMQPGASVLVVGTGPIGLAVIFWARRLGAGQIVALARSRNREALAATMGASSFATSAEELAEVMMGKHACIVFECVGTPGMIERCIGFVRPRGTVVVCGVCVCADQVTPAYAILKEARVQFALAYGISDFRRVAETLDAGAVEPRELITDTVGFADFPLAFEALRHRTSQCKVMLDPTL